VEYLLAPPQRDLLDLNTSVGDDDEAATTLALLEECLPARSAARCIGRPDASTRSLARRPSTVPAGRTSALVRSVSVRVMPSPKELRDVTNVEA
jgi:hypothetical protein